MGSVDSNEGHVLVGRTAPPSHFQLKIESFSLLSKSPVNKYTTDAFDAGGFKWKLSLYPNGDKWNKAEGYISIYLESAETSCQSTGWEINVLFNIFVFNQIEDKYVTVQDDSIIRRYHVLKTKWGFSKFMDLKTFANPSNGYLIDDTCVFGVEVFVVKNTFKGERLSVLEEHTIYSHTWKVDNFSTLLDQRYDSEPFGCYNWNIRLFPNGNGVGKGNNISLYLSYAQSSVPLNTKLFVKFILRIKDQMNEKHNEIDGDIVFSPSTVPDWGFTKFMSLAKLKDPKQGYLVNDTCIIEAEITLIALIINEL